MAGKLQFEHHVASLYSKQWGCSYSLLAWAKNQHQKTHMPAMAIAQRVAAIKIQTVEAAAVSTVTTSEPESRKQTWYQHRIMEWSSTPKQKNPSKDDPWYHSHNMMEWQQASWTLDAVWVLEFIKVSIFLKPEDTIFENWQKLVFHWKIFLLLRQTLIL